MSVNKRFWKIRASLVAAAVLSTCCAAFAANRCVDDRGKVTYQDAPCASTSSGSAVNTSEAFSTHPKNVSPTAQANGSSTAAVSTPPDGAGGYTSYRGAWRGPSQFELSLNGVRDEGAHSVAPMVVEVRPDGEVVGVIPAAGCHISGLATQNVAPYMASFDVSLKGCSDTRFNARLSGNLFVIAASKEAKLHLVGLAFQPSLPLTVKAQQISVDAVLRH